MSACTVPCIHKVLKLTLRTRVQPSAQITGLNTQGTLSALTHRKPWASKRLAQTQATQPMSMGIQPKQPKGADSRRTCEDGTARPLSHTLALTPRLSLPWAPRPLPASRSHASARPLFPSPPLLQPLDGLPSQATPSSVSRRQSHEELPEHTAALLPSPGNGGRVCKAKTLGLLGVHPAVRTPVRQRAVTHREVGRARPAR